MIWGYPYSILGNTHGHHGNVSVRSVAQGHQSLPVAPCAIQRCIRHSCRRSTSVDANPRIVCHEAFRWVQNKLYLSTAKQWQGSTMDLHGFVYCIKQWPLSPHAHVYAEYMRILIFVMSTSANYMRRAKNRNEAYSTYKHTHTQRHIHPVHAKHTPCR